MRKVFFIVSVVFLITIVGRYYIYSNGISAKTITVNHEGLFDDLLVPAPDTLSMEYLKNLPTFRCIHHDGFDRLTEILVDQKTKKKYSKYSLADKRTLGKNSFQDAKEHAYKEITNASFDVGVKDCSVAYNISTGNRREKKIKYIDAERSDYGFLFSRTANEKTEAMIAFRVEDINNFYYLRADSKHLDLCLVKNGNEKQLQRYSHSGSMTFYGLIEGTKLYLYADYHYVGMVELTEFFGVSLCGLYFSGERRCEVDDFIVNYIDDKTESPLDKYIEDWQLPNDYALLGCEEGLITQNNKTNNSRASARFELEYYHDWEAHKIGFKRRSELCPIAKESSSLDSWICSFDVYFPGGIDKGEYYQYDELDELFWQMHAPSIINMLSPNVALYLRKDIIRFEALNRSILRHDRLEVGSNMDFDYDGIIAKLVDSSNSNDESDFLEIERGKWHNFTIYVKEGYSETHLPRSIVYLNGKKVIDWNIPNTQNCGKGSTYLQMGIYKWPWATSFINSNAS